MSSTRNKTIGLLLIILPFFLLTIVLAGFGVASTFVPSLDSPTVHFFLSLFGIFGTVVMLAGIPLGIYLLVKKDPNAVLATRQKMDKRSGLGAQSIIPDEIKHWNWGAAGLTWIWGSYYSVWISFLMWISPISLFWWIVLGIYGNEWAWRNHAWASVAEFQATQDKWKPWGILFVVVRVLFFGLFLLIMLATIGGMIYSTL